MVKYFRFPVDYVLWGISYQNLNMLLATIPQYESEEGEEGEREYVGEGIDDFTGFAKYAE